MRFLIDPLHRFRRDMRVFLRGRERGMTENLFDEHKVSAVFQHVSGEGMPQRVRRK